MRNYKEDPNNSIFFVMHYYGELSNAKTALLNFRKCYPFARLMIICERNLDDANYLASFSDADYLINGQRIKTLEYGGLWSDRFFKLFLEKRDNEKILCRFDPDVIWHYPVKFQEEFKCQWNAEIFGTESIGMNFPHKVIRGACIFYRESAVKRILESRSLEDTLYKNNQLYGYRRYSDHNLQYGEIELNEWHSSQDKIIAHISDQLGIIKSNFSEIMIIYRTLPSVFQTERKWAVTNFPM